MLNTDIDVPCGNGKIMCIICRKKRAKSNLFPCRWVSAARTLLLKSEGLLTQRHSTVFQNTLAVNCS